MTYTVKNSFYEKLQLSSDTSTSEQVISWVNNTTWYDLTGSAITYTPSHLSKYVIYEYHFYFNRGDQWQNTKCSFEFRLMKDESDGNGFVVFGDNTTGSIGDVEDRTRKRSTVSLKFCLDASTWTKPKALKLQVKRNSSSQVAVFNALYRFYDASGSDIGSSSNVHFYPTVSCYSVSI